MGGNMARRLQRAGHRVVAFNRSPEKTREIMAEGLEGAFTAEEAVGMLPAPHIVWLMVPAGGATEGGAPAGRAPARPAAPGVAGGGGGPPPPPTPPPPPAVVRGGRPGRRGAGPPPGGPRAAPPRGLRL